MRGKAKGPKVQLQPLYRRLEEYLKQVREKTLRRIGFRAYRACGGSNLCGTVTAIRSNCKYERP